MSLNRWKVLACTLTVGVGGLAVFATDPAPGKTDAPKAEAPKEPAPLPNLTVKPATPAGGTDTPAPVVPVKGDEFEITLPVPPAAKPEEKKSGAEPVFEPIAPPPVAPIILPVGGEAADKDGKKPDAGKKDVPVIPAVPARPDEKAKGPPMPLVVPDPVKPAPALEVPPVPELKKPAADPVPPPVKTAPPVAPPAVVVPGPKPDVPPVVVTPAPEAAKVPLTPTPVKGGDSARLKMLLRVGDGQPRFEIRNTTTTELLMKVYGEKIEMQAPPEAKSTLAGVTATGKVRFTAPGIEGTCDQLTILSGTGEVLLKGNIHLKTKRGKTWSELTAEKMVYQIGTAGLGAPAGSRISPASFNPD